MDPCNVFTGYDLNDSMSMSLNSSCSEIESANIFADMVEKYIDLSKWKYNADSDERSTAPLPAESSSNQTGLQSSVFLAELPWCTSLVDIFGSRVELIKVKCFCES